MNNVIAVFDDINLVNHQTITKLETPKKKNR